MHLIPLYQLYMALAQRFRRDHRFFSTFSSRGCSDREIASSRSLALCDTRML